MSDTLPPPSYTVLRIKRKATEAPLSSLVIQDGANPAKKRREINPLRNRGVFRLAETVPDTWKGEGQEGVVLRERIKGLLSAPSDTSPLPSPKLSEAKAEQPPSDQIEDKESTVQQGQIPDASQTDSPKPRQNSISSGKRVQYRVVQPPPARPAFGLPPRVITIAEEEESKEKALNFVDAEAVSTASSSRPSRKASLPSAEEQQEMAPFLSMLEDVLKFESPRPSLGKSRITGNEEDTYVYDLYYKDNRPDQISSLPLNLDVNIGALLGYGEDEEDDFETISEPEDEADEDSNEEDYYRNDYPEDEDADEDMEGFRDAFDDEEEDVRSDDDEKGLWDYR